MMTQLDPRLALTATPRVAEIFTIHSRKMPFLVSANLTTHEKVALILSHHN
jgi:hypothetical protein